MERQVSNYYVKKFLVEKLGFTIDKPGFSNFGRYPMFTSVNQGSGA